MPDQWVKRNHYNPCLWTAYWNTDYYAAATSGATDLPPHRSQLVFSLNVKADKILRTTVENVHYDKNLGEAEISLSAAEEFCRRHYPDQYADFCRDNENAIYPVYLNFEDILAALDNLPHYEHLRAVIARQDLASPMDKGMLACVMYLQAMRSHAVMNSLIEWHDILGVRKFEFFWTLKQILSNTDLLAEAIAPLAFCHWTLYRTRVSTFPLTDSPVLVQPHSIMLALSPRLLLEAVPRRVAPELQWRVKNGIKPGKLAEFRHRTIGNTFREIIFDDRSTLEFWQRTREFRERVRLIGDMKSYNQMVEREARELWLVNALGNRS